MKRSLFSFILLLFAITPTLAMTAPLTRTNISYGPDPRQRLDFSHPGGEAAAPLVIFIHGGGWLRGDKQRLPAEGDRARLLAAGIAVATINYRLTPDHPLPVPIDDAARAIQFLRHHASSYGIDSGRIALAGNSAGGCTALYLGCASDRADPDAPDPVARESTRVRAVYATHAQTFLDPARLLRFIGPGALKHPMTWTAVAASSPETLLEDEAAAERLRRFSPIDHLSAGDPAVYFFYNRPPTLPAEDADTGIHSPEFAHRFAARAQEVGVPCYLSSEKEGIVSESYQDGIAFLISELQ